MKIDNTIYNKSPKDDPKSYPGKIPDFSFLYIDSDFYKLDISEGRRIGQSYIIWDGQRPADARNNRESLNNRLVKMGSTGLQFRYPVVAYGSNANPSQLQKKYITSGIDSVVPVIQATVIGLDIVYSPHVTSYGSIPATTIPSKESTTHIHVTFVDFEQLRVLDTSESNYIRVKISSNDFPLSLASGEVLSEYYIYISRHGYLKLEQRIFRLSNILVDKSPYIPLSQEQILTKLIERWNTEFPDEQFVNIDEFLDTVRNNHLVRQSVTNWLQSTYSEMYKSSFFEQENGSEMRKYRDILPIWSNMTNDEFVVQPNYSGRKNGDYTIAVNANTADDLKLKSYVYISHSLGNDRFSMVGKLKIITQVAERTVHVDQTIRNSLGIDIGDKVNIGSISGKNKNAFDIFVARNYLIMRVQSADILMIEKNNCAMSKIAMDIIGVSDGDVVVLESTSENDNGELQFLNLRLRAYRIPDSTMELRSKNESGVFLSKRFPNCSEILGVYPDLPWVFIDEAARRELGIGTCSPIRIRASRRYQIVKEAQNISLLILVTLLGAISVFEVPSLEPFGLLSVPSSLCILIPAMLAITILTYLSLRQRLLP